jgi:hypothetical protein
VRESNLEEMIKLLLLIFNLTFILAADQGSSSKKAKDAALKEECKNYT